MLLRLKQASSAAQDNSALLDERRDRILTTRKRCREALEVQAKKMIKLSNVRIPPVAVGATVRVPIPDVDRARGSPRNVLAAVISVENDFYKLCTFHAT